MNNYILLFGFFFLCIVANSQDTICGSNGDTITSKSNKSDKYYRFIIGYNAGVSCSYSDKAFIFSPPVSLSFDFHITNGYFVQIAPKFSWSYPWNEYYLTIPLHVRKRFGKRLSLYLGPCITWDIGYFKDLGISMGAYFHISKRSSFMLSAFTFTLYDYYIDYLYIPVGISYNYHFLKK